MITWIVMVGLFLAIVILIAFLQDVSGKMMAIRESLDRIGRMLDNSPLSGVGPNAPTILKCLQEISSGRILSTKRWMSFCGHCGRKLIESLSGPIGPGPTPFRCPICGALNRVDMTNPDGETYVLPPGHVCEPSKCSEGSSVEIAVRPENPAHTESSHR